MKTIEPYLIFDGNCSEAFAFYESAFGVKTAFMCRYRDLPDNDKSVVGENDMNKIVHALLPASDQVFLMGADSLGDAKSTMGNNIHLALNVGNDAEAHRLYDNLSVGGTIVCPLQKTSWAELYAMFTDKFGVRWMINYILPEK